MNRKEKRARLREMHMCIDCGSFAVGVRCTKCLEKARESKRRLKERGICTNCGAFPALDDRTRCQSCVDRDHARYLASKSQKLCTCGQPVVNQKTKCQDCINKHLTRRLKYKTNGLCINCGQPANGKVVCQTCFEKNRIRRRERRKEYIQKGLCVQCGQKVIKGRTMCEICLVKIKACKLGLGANDLIELFNRQKGICPYSGELLSLSEAALDHRVPKSRDGADTLDNLQWVSKWVNQMKHDMNDAEFRTAIILLAQRMTNNRTTD